MANETHYVVTVKVERVIHEDKVTPVVYRDSGKATGQTTPYTERHVETVANIHITDKVLPYLIGQTIEHLRLVASPPQTNSDAPTYRAIRDNPQA